MITVVSWNMDGFNKNGRDKTWRVLRETGADVALLQDAAEPLPGVAAGIEFGETAWDRPIRRRPPLIVRLSDRVAVEWFAPVAIGDTNSGRRNAGERLEQARRCISASHPVRSVRFHRVR